jgi:hypothetical protein
MAKMYDAIGDSMPSDGDIYAGYVDGAWPTFGSLTTWHPGKRYVAITVFGRPGIQVVDCETGDLTPAQAAAWAKAEVNGGRRPTIYCNTSTQPAVVSELAALGLEFVRDVDWWEAHYDNDPTLTPGSAAKQYQSTDAYDVSSTDGKWPDSLAPAPAPAPTQGSVYMIPANCTDDGAVRAQIRDWWGARRSDPMTGPNRDILVLFYHLPANQVAWGKNGFGGDPDLLLAQITDDAATKGVLRPNFVGSV